MIMLFTVNIIYNTIYSSFLSVVYPAMVWSRWEWGRGSYSHLCFKFVDHSFQQCSTEFCSMLYDKLKLFGIYKSVTQFAAKIKIIWEWCWLLIAQKISRDSVNITE